jgi:ATP-dependent Clp protease ATP-binding subunit ClpC
MLGHTTKCASRVILRARNEAEACSGDPFAGELLLLAILGERTSAAAAALGRLGLDCPQARRELKQALREPAPDAGAEEYPLLVDGDHVMHHAPEEVRQLKSPVLGTPHLLLGILSQEDGPTVQFLRGKGIDLDALRQAAREAAGQGSDADGGVDRPAGQRSPRKRCGCCATATPRSAWGRR